MNDASYHNANISPETAVRSGAQTGNLAEALPIDLLTGDADLRTNQGKGAIRVTVATTPMTPQAREPRIIVGAASLLAVFLVWEACARNGVIETVFLPAPSKIVSRTVELIQQGVLLRHAFMSIRFVLIGVGVAAIIGIAAAVACHMSKLVQWAINPFVELTRGIAPLALIPLFMLLFGIGASSKVAITVWVAWIPIFLNTLEGIESADQRLVTAARSFGADRMRIARTVLLPSAAPFILSGVRLAFGAAFLAVVAAEMFGSTGGLGFFVLEMSQTFKIVDMYAAIFAIGLLGLIINSLVILCARRLTPWRGL